MSLLICGQARADRPPPRLIETRPADDWNNRFAGNAGWVGGDGVYSVAIADNRVLFLFGDTLLGKANLGRRSAHMVNNTVGLLSLADARGGIRFVSGPEQAGKPTALLKPADGRGWFWPHAGIISHGRLYLFLAHVDKAGKDGPFGFQQIGEYLATIDNPLDEPLRWRIDECRLPFAKFAESHETVWGSAVLADGPWVYVYGITDRQKQLGSKQLIVARTPPDKLTDFAAWRFWNGTGWSATPTAERLFGGLANEFSVGRLDDDRRFVLVYTDSGLSERILGRFADSPVGAWSDAVVLYRCPEGNETGVFCYAAKAHSWAARGNELLVSYCTNAWDFGRLFADDDVYRPRFIRVRLAP